MPAFNDLSGKKFGRLTAIKRVENDKNSNTQFLCVCECGKEHTVNSYYLVSGKIRSCGCLKIDFPSRFKHGQRAKITPEYNTWCGIIKRCYNPHEKAYVNYGGRGITVCDRWRNEFLLFLEDMGERPSKTHSIDRIDVNGNYESSNCRWATKSMQNSNQRKRCTNTSGVTGVKLDKSSGKWLANIGVNGKRIILGKFEIFEDAVKARKEAELVYF